MNSSALFASFPWNFLFYSPLSTLKKRRQSPTTPIAPHPPPLHQKDIADTILVHSYKQLLFSDLPPANPTPFLLHTVPPKLQLSHIILRTRYPKQFPIAAKREFPQRKWRTCTATAAPTGAVIGSETPPLSLRAALWLAAAAWGWIAIGWEELGAAVAPSVGLICCCCCCWCCCWRCCSCCLATTNRVVEGFHRVYILLFLQGLLLLLLHVALLQGLLQQRLLLQLLLLGLSCRCRCLTHCIMRLNDLGCIYTKRK